jgi:hypothetical protein
MYDGSGSKDLVAVSKDGKVIKDNNIASANDINRTCEAVKKGSTTYKLYANGSSSSTTIPDYLDASAGGKHLVRHPTNNKIYLSDSECSASGVEVDTLSASPDDAKIVLGGDGKFYIAVRTGTSLKYYKVSGNTSDPITLSPDPSLYNPGGSDNPKYSYALDGEGRLYAINSSADYPVLVYRTSGTELGRVNVPANYTKLLGFENRVLGRDNASTPNLYQIYYNGSAVVNSSVTTISHTPITRCTDANTVAIDGEGTDFIRCAYNDGSDGYLYSLKYSDGTYLVAVEKFSSATINTDGVNFVAGKALVSVGSNIKLCTTTNTPSISCNDTGAPDFDRTLLRDGSTDKYLKSNGKNNVLYTSGGAVKAGDIFDPPASVLIPATGISGGSASFDLTKFAYIAGSGSCLTSIAYLSSPTAVPKAYTIEQPSGACVKGILQVR